MKKSAMRDFGFESQERTRLIDLDALEVIGWRLVAAVCLGALWYLWAILPV